MALNYTFNRTDVSAEIRQNEKGTVTFIVQKLFNGDFLNYLITVAESNM